MDQPIKPTDDEIMRALCCGGKCNPGPNTGLCHRWDFMGEVARIRALLEQTSSDATRQQYEHSDA